jgi:hypothetical protein
MNVIDKADHSLMEKIFGRAQKPNVLLVATTTGQGVEHYLELSRKHHVKVIAVAAHRLGNPRWKPFDPAIWLKIERQGGDVILETMPAVLKRVTGRLLKPIIPFIKTKMDWAEQWLGISGRVCLQALEISANQKAIEQGQVILAMAGKSSIFLFEIKKTMPLQVGLLEMISME